jgi:hypothetical protein
MRRLPRWVRSSAGVKSALTLGRPYLLSLRTGEWRCLCEVSELRRLLLTCLRLGGVPCSLTRRTALLRLELAHLARLHRRTAEEMDEGTMDVVAAATASLFFIDTSPMWMEKFISTAKRRGIIVADADSGREYDLRLIDDEAAFRACGKP